MDAPKPAATQIDVTAPPEPKLSQAKQLSRSAAKRIGNLTIGTIHAMTDGKARALEQTSDDLQRVRRDYGNLRAIMEAVVRRHGEQVFDRSDIEKSCMNGDIQFSVTENRITVRLTPKPGAV